MNAVPSAARIVIGRGSFLMKYGQKKHTQIAVLERKRAAPKRRRGYGEESKREERMGY
jgi:hypothetical protein